MKKETKELVQWIIKRLEHLKSEAIESGTLQTELPQEYEKAFTFLNSLPEIESHLCRGGYIQDRNGTPCCDGDNVKFVVADATDDEWCLGRLIWKPKLSAFQIISNVFTCFVSNVKWFEKK